jgi:hypothetical protein
MRTASTLITSVLALIVFTAWPAHGLAQTSGQVGTTNFIGVVTGLNQLRAVTHQNPSKLHRRGSLVFDDQYAYLATPDGLFRTAPTISPDSEFTFLGFANYPIIDLVIHQNVLYILKEGGDPRTNSLDAHSFLKSVDHGTTFIPLDEGLKYCFRDHCEYLYATRVFFRNNLIFLAAGGGNNFFVSSDEGKNWTVLYGQLSRMVCSDAAVEMTGNDVLFGGECPLDAAYLRKGTLREDMLGWTETGYPREVMGLAELENRNIMIIKHSANTPFALAGCEGGLLKSTDLGETYQFKIKHGGSDPAAKYPYFHESLITTRYRDLVFAGGWDNRKINGYLSYSRDHGETWTDISDLVLTPEFAALDVAFLTEDPSGRILIGIPGTDKTLRIAEVVVSAPPALLTDNDQSRALALDSVTLAKEPFGLFNEYNFSGDGYARISFFATNVPPDATNILMISVRAEDAQHRIHVLPVEYVGGVTNFPWITQIVVRLPDSLSGAGEVQICLIFRGVESNRAGLEIR